MQTSASVVAGGSPGVAANTDGKHSSLAFGTLGALGIVYGDIGNQPPLLATRIAFTAPHSIPPSTDNVLGVLSLILWSLIIVVSIKYLVFVLRADNKGEGGILALMALCLSKSAQRRLKAPAGSVSLGCLRGSPLRRRHHHAGDLRTQSQWKA